MKIVVNADDFGKSPSVNEAISFAFEKRIINQTTAMATEDSFKDAMILAKQNGFIDRVGLHINLDEGCPITENIKNIDAFCNIDGVFNKKFKSSKIKSTIFLDKAVKSCCLEEIHAQMQRFLENGGVFMHVDSHHHVHFKRSVLSLLIPLAHDMNFKSMRICPFYQKDSFLKAMVKKRTNSIIKNSFDTVDCFVGSFLDYQTNKNGSHNDSSFEVMLHPDIVDGKYVDILKRNMLYEDLLNIKII